MRNYVQPGEDVTVPAPAPVLSGGVVVIGELVGVAATDAATGADVAIATTGVFDLPKVAAEAFAIGDPVHHDGALATSDDTADRIGIAVATAGAGAASVRVRLGG